MRTKINGEVSFWYADIGGLPEHRAALSGDVQADVCIIGAGYTGLWTAYYLLKSNPALKVVIVEKEFAGFGASGRNGGWLTGGFGWPRAKYLQNGDRDSVIRLDRALIGTVDEIIKVAELEHIDADIQRTDNLSIACTPAQMQRVKNSYDDNVQWEAPAGRFSLIGGADVTERIRVKNAMGALVTHGVARIHPAKLVRGLAKAVERAGATIFEQTPVTQIAKGVVTTQTGVVRAPFIIRATEGFTSQLPGFERRWLPLNSAVAVTEPLSDEMWEQIGWNGYELLGDASHQYSYAQRTKDNRIAIGGRGVPYRFGSGIDTNGKTQPKTVQKLREILTRMLPQTADIGFDHAWCGVLGVARDWCAAVGFDESTGIGWGGGYVGRGISTSNLAGRTLADLVLKRDTERVGLPWVNRSAKNWEPEPLRWLGVHSMYQLYKIADHREQAHCETTSKFAKFANSITGR